MLLIFHWNDLTQIACMGTTKLKSCFKKYYDCTITEYIQQRRMSQAEYLLDIHRSNSRPNCSNSRIFHIKPIR